MEPKPVRLRLPSVGMLATESAVGSAEETRRPAGRHGDAGSFDEFYRSHLGKIYRALVLTLGSDDLAREAADEAMTRAYADWRKVSEMGNPAGWVYRVGLNWATSWWRKTRREQGQLHDGMPHRTSGPDPEALAARLAVERLPLKQRSVVVCRVLLELSTAETAATLAVSEGTVKSRLSRALTELRRALESEK